MKLHLAKERAITLMHKHNLYDWKFAWNNRQKTFGVCNCYKKTIYLSKALTEVNEWQQVKDTILHEIAHALTPGHGHDNVWKNMCRKIGAKPKRLCSDGKLSVSKFVLHCDSCGKQYKKYRRPSKVFSCGRCGTPNRWTPEKCMVIKINPLWDNEASEECVDMMNFYNSQVLKARKGEKYSLNRKMHWKKKAELMTDELTYSDIYVYLNDDDNTPDKILEECRYQISHNEDCAVGEDEKYFLEQAELLQNFINKWEKV